MNRIAKYFEETNEKTTPVCPGCGDPSPNGVACDGCVSACDPARVNIDNAHLALYVGNTAEALALLVDAVEIIARRNPLRAC